MLPKLLNYTLGWFYLVGGPLIHIFLMTQRRDIYSAVDDRAVNAYQVLWNQVVLPNLVVLVLLLIAFEIGVGALILSSKPTRAAFGHLAGLLFNLLLVPFAFFLALPNLLLVAGHAGLYLWIEHKMHGNWHFLPLTLMGRRA